MIYELFANPSTRFFILLIAVTFIVALVSDKGGRRKRFIEYAPTLMTSLGMLGTFWGVVLGLLDFDTVNIDHSIPSLLSGLKTAFVTSIFGMLASISFNAIDSWRNKESHAEEDEAKNKFYNATLLQAELLDNLNKGFFGDTDDSLVNQLKLIRHESNEHRKKFEYQLWEKIDACSNNISSNATGQIIEALESIVLSFNDNLVAQFGENFKALDLSVKKMVDWQESYKEQISIMDSQLKSNVDSMRKSDKAIAAISKRCESIPATMSDLEKVIQINQHQIAELSRHLEAFVMMRDQAIVAVPLIREGVENITSLMVSSADTVQNAIEKSGKHLLINAERVNKSLENNIKVMSDSIQQSSISLVNLSSTIIDGNEKIRISMEQGAQKIGHEYILSNEKIQSVVAGGISKISDGFISDKNKMHLAITEGVQKLSADLLVENQKIRSTIENSYTVLHSMATKSISDFNEAVQAQRQSFNKSMEDEMARELDMFGKSLVSMNQKFINSYQDLVSNYNAALRPSEEVLAEVRS